MGITKNKAFTLAEILITLGVIGIVAAITIPSLSHTLYEKRTVALLKETQSIMAQAVRAAEEEEGEVSGWGLDNNQTENDAKIIAEKLLKHIKVAQDCGTYDPQGICMPNMTYKYLNGGSNWGSYATSKSYYKIKLNNGVGILWRSGGSSEAQNKGLYIDFIMDVNGKTPPNVIGQDIFELFYEKSSVRAAGAPGYAASSECRKNGTGWGCAYRVLTTGKIIK